MTIAHLRKAFGLAVILGASFVGGEAAANSVSFNLQTQCSGSGSSVLTCLSNGSQLSVLGASTSGAGGTIEGATTHIYSGGVGVVNKNESGSEPNHAMDNSGHTDFVALVFDSAVSITNLGIGWYSGDADLSLLAYTSAAPLTPIGGKTLSDLLLNGWEVAGNYDANDLSNPFAVNPSGLTSTYWIVSAWNSAFGTECAPTGFCQADPVDYFKLKTIHVEYPMNEVPLPASALLLLAGLGGLAVARRR